MNRLEIDPYLFALIIDWAVVVGARYFLNETALTALTLAPQSIRPLFELFGDLNPIDTNLGFHGSTRSTDSFFVRLQDSLTPGTRRALDDKSAQCTRCG